VETFTRRYGAKNMAEAFEKTKEFNILDDLDKITCPTIALVGEGEGDESLYQAQRFYEVVSGPKVRVCLQKKKVLNPIVKLQI